MTTRNPDGGVGGSTVPCVIDTALPAIVTVEDRAAPELAAIEYDSIPAPVRAAAGMVIQLGMPAAVQVHPAAVLTDNELESPAAGTVSVVGVTV